VRYAADTPLIREALILTLVFATLVRGALEVLPVLADGAFGQGAAGLGMLTAAAGAGALSSAMLKALGRGGRGRQHSAQRAGGDGRWVSRGRGHGPAPVWPLALLATAVSGFTATWCGVSLQAAIQTDLPDAYRGRVMSLWTVVGFGTVAIGAGLIGGLAELVGSAPRWWAAVSGLPAWRFGASGVQAAEFHPISGGERTCARRKDRT
jgi:hypothetical protein